MTKLQTISSFMNGTCRCALQAQRGAVIGLLVIAALSASAQASRPEAAPNSELTANAEDLAVLTINDEPVSMREYRMVMQRKVASVFSYFKEHENLDDHADYWAESGPASPLARLRKVTLEELIRIKVNQRRAKELGLTSDTSFAHFVKAFDDENSRRSAAKASGEPVYGPLEYRLTGYYYVKLRELEYALKQTLGKQLESQVTESEIGEFYDKHKTALKGRPLAEMRTDIIRVLGKQKAEDELAKKHASAQVKIDESRLKLITPREAPSGLAVLDPEEAEAGWRLLWDGATTKGWRSARSTAFPTAGWQIKDGVLSVLKSDGGEGGQGGDIITVDKFSDFELSLDFKLSAGANSGIKYFVDPELNKGAGSSIGLEYQLLDDALHPDAKLGKNGNRTIASLYDLYPAAATKKPNAIGKWNTARIVSRGDHVEHWLNGEKVVEYTRLTPQFRTDVQGSKYKVWPGFGELREGHILLQDHGDAVSFRNIKIRATPSASERN